MPPKAASGSSNEVKPVARAACLACRLAKRRCDGVQPHCGPCITRGFPQPPPEMPQEERAVKPNSTRYCVWVASKRGGPRYKGVTGAELNEAIKQEKEAEKAQKGETGTGAGASGNTKSRGIKRERGGTSNKDAEIVDGRARSVSTSSTRSESTATYSQYQSAGGYQQPVSPPLSDPSQSSGPLPKRSRQQDSLQSSRTSFPTSYPNLYLDPNGSFQPSFRSNSISASAEGSGSRDSTQSKRPPIDGVLEAADIARAETLSVASQRPEMFTSSKVRHGAADTSSRFQQQQNQPQQGLQFQPQSQFSNFGNGNHSFGTQGSSSFQASTLPPLTHQSHNRNDQFNLQSQGSPLSDGNLNSTSSGPSNSNSFHPFAMPNQTNTNFSNPASLPPLRGFENIPNFSNGATLHQLQGNHYNFPQSSTRDALASSTNSGWPTVTGSQVQSIVQGQSAAQFSGNDLHALSSANLDLWQRLQKESESDNFAQLYYFGDGEGAPNSFANGVGNGNQDQFGQGPGFQQQVDQRDVFSLDLNTPTAMNLEATASGILGNDFDLTTDMFNSFYNKLESLPKAGVNHDEVQEEEKRLSRKERSRRAGDKDGTRSGGVDEENRARTILSVFFENVYPTCPVLLPSSSLSSLAFYFTEKPMPCALWASICATAALHLGDEAHVTLRKGGGNFHDILRKRSKMTGDCTDDESVFSADEAGDEAGDEAMETDSKGRPRISAQDIAAHHARTAEWLIQRYTDLIAAESGHGQTKKEGKGNGASASPVPSLSPSSTSTFSHGTAETPKAPFPGTARAGPHSAEASICSLLPDLGLVAIEATSAKTLLAHYYYGGASGEGDGRRRAWELAKEAWEGAKDLELWDEGWEKEKEAARQKAADQSLLKSTSLNPTLAELIQSMKQERESDASFTSSTDPMSPTPAHVPSAGSPFSKSQRIEWARRAYWCAYEAATVMTTTGGFQPIDLAMTRDTDDVFQLRPGVGSLSRSELESASLAELMRPPTDRGWATMIRGSQLVSRAYRSLYNLDALNSDIATGKSRPGQKDLFSRRSDIFEQMLSLDEDIGGFLIDESAKKNPSSNGVTLTVDVNGEFAPEEELHKALSVSGTLMATGATIILHRAQAYGRARLFMQPSCCVPRASETYETGSQYKQGKPTKSKSPADTRSEKPVEEDQRDPMEGEEDEEDEVVPASKPINAASVRPGQGISSRASSLLSMPLKSHSIAPANNAPTAGAVNANAAKLSDTFFAGGPFLPSHSFNRCRIAAETMARALKPVLSELLRKIEVDDTLELEEAASSDPSDHAPQVNSSPKMSSLSIQDMPSSDSRWSGNRSRESSTSRAQKALRILNNLSSDDSKRRAIIKKAPKLPPFSACSCVLGAYVLLMQSLAVRINSGAATPAQPGSPPSSHSQPTLPAGPGPSPSSSRSLAQQVTARHVAQQSELAGPLINQFRNTANDFSKILDFFSTVWPIGHDYKAELSALLAANESLN